MKRSKNYSKRSRSRRVLKKIDVDSVPNLSMNMNMNRNRIFQYRSRPVLINGKIMRRSPFFRKRSSTSGTVESPSKKAKFSTPRYISDDEEDFASSDDESASPPPEMKVKTIAQLLKERQDREGVTDLITPEFANRVKSIDQLLKEQARGGVTPESENRVNQFTIDGKRKRKSKRRTKRKSKSKSKKNDGKRRKSKSKKKSKW
jgi:hypothetical protein